MKQIQIHNKTFIECIPAQQIEQEVQAIAQKMNRDLAGKKPLFLSVLNGAFMFTSDLLKCIDFECNISFVKLSSYKGTQTSGKISKLIGVNEPVEGRTIVVLEDIVDSGTTLFSFTEILKSLGATEIYTAAMFFKPGACRYNVKIDYIGMELPDDFVVGYGLDYDGLGRNYRDLYKLKH